MEELVEIAGGTPIFPDLRGASLAKDRIVTAERVIAAAPEVFIGSWCGKPVRKEKVRARAGWGAVPFVRDDRIFEVKSTYILQPGPAALTDGVRQLHAILCAVVGSSGVADSYRPGSDPFLRPDLRGICVQPGMDSWMAPPRSILRRCPP